MKKILLSTVLFAILFFVGSCQSMRNYTYFQNIDTVNLAPSKGLPETKIMPKDELTIYVKTTNAEASKPFNLFTNGSYANADNNNLTGYLVNNDGTINFPVLGRIHVGGLTRPEVEDTIAKMLKPYLSEKERPVVICRLKSYHITMIGELGSKVLDVPDEKMNIIDAIAQSGDLTMYGKRTNILLVREDSTGEAYSPLRHDERTDLQ